MVKIIEFTDIQLKSVEVYEADGKIYAALLYALKDKNNNIWEQKRYLLKDEDFTSAQKQFIKNILNTAYTKIKIIEEV